MSEFWTLGWVFSNLPDSGFAPDSPSVAFMSGLLHCACLLIGPDPVKQLSNSYSNDTAVPSSSARCPALPCSAEARTRVPLHITSPTSKFVS